MKAKKDMSAQLPFRISVCGRTEIPAFENRNVTHLLSIDNPGDMTPTPRWLDGTHWHVLFQDFESDDEALRFEAVPPAKDDIRQIIDWAGECLAESKRREVHLLIHCMAGASRSPATAFAIFCMLLGPGQEENALKHLLAIRPEAYPNKLVVKFADDLMDRGGKMVEAIRPIREAAIW